MTHVARLFSTFYTLLSTVREDAATDAVSVPRDAIGLVIREEFNSLLAVVKACSGFVVGGRPFVVLIE